MDTALVDIGNVLLKLRRNPVDFLLSPAAGETAREAFLQLYCCFESGVVSEMEFVSRGMDITGFSGSLDDFVEAWCDIFQPLPDMWDWCARQKEKGMRLILFSNTNPLHRARFFKEPVFALFDDAVYSYEIGEMKPGEGMYEYALNALKVNPENTIYVDDLEANIETGLRFGFHCVKFLPNEPARSVCQLDHLCE